MEENDLTKIFVFISIAVISICLSNIIKTFRITDLENKITDLENKVEELEKQSKEVHEYILNRIGG